MPSKRPPAEFRAPSEPFAAGVRGLARPPIVAGNGGEKPTMADDEGRKRRAEAGAANLAAWTARNPKGAAARKHGVNTLLNNGVLPSGSEATITRADALITKAIEELGGESALTSKQMMILESQRTALRVVMLTSDYIAETGLLDTKRGRPHPLLATAVSFANAVRLNCEMLQLGIDSSADPATMSPEKRRAWSAQYVADALADDGSLKP